MEYSTELLAFSYACSSLSDNIKQLLKYSCKTVLPPTILHQLQKDNNLTFPLFFNIKNKDSGFSRVCAVHEFTAPPGVVHAPYYILNELGIKEGDNIFVELVSLQRGTALTLRPHLTEFINLSNPKAILEKVMSRDYSENC